jgi:thymidylate synthase (FAD)
MLEHGTVYLKVTNKAIKDAYEKNKYSKTTTVVTNLGTIYYIVTNFRVLIENNWLDDLRYLCEPTEYREKRYTLKFITSIGITRELIRHRHFSFANESTRYCNYSKDKFSGEITFVKPTWVNIPSELPEGTKLEDGPYGWCNSNYIHIYCKDIKSKWFMKACLEAEYSYLHVINEQNATPQEAREILPLCTKSEIIMTGFESDWKDFFKLRCDKAAHPDMQIIANKAKELLKL